ncbi:MAG TPA: hypothetical protein DF613_11670 [Lachnospiraceae bacterium]|nr:hypothetical protein [Lachnospiraceae bacterium]
MGLWEIFVIGLGLSMDAFAVSICKGLSMKRMNWRQAVLVGVYFGGFQFLMPLIGYLLGTTMADLIVSIDHWIAFGLLGLIGFNMIREAGHSDADCLNDNFDVKTMLMLAVATSIDALAVGITFAFLRVQILTAALIIGVTTFLLSVAGVRVGNVFGSRFRTRAEYAGGIILILIGLKILLEHLGE